MAQLLVDLVDWRSVQPAKVCENVAFGGHGCDTCYTLGIGKQSTFSAHVAYEDYTKGDEGVST